MKVMSRSAPFHTQTERRAPSTRAASRPRQTLKRAIQTAKGKRAGTMWVAAVVLACSCQGEDSRLREEASRLVELYGQVKYEAPPADREAKLASIEQAVFVSSEVVGARTVCVSGHRQLIAAQRSQDDTAREIDKSLASTDGGAPMAQGTIERLQAKLATAQEQLGKARTQLEDCEAQVRALNVRFGKR